MSLKFILFSLGVNVFLNISGGGSFEKKFSQRNPPNITSQCSQSGSVFIFNDAMFVNTSSTNCTPICPTQDGFPKEKNSYTKSLTLADVWRLYQKCKTSGTNACSLHDVKGLTQEGHFIVGYYCVKSQSIIDPCSNATGTTEHLLHFSPRPADNMPQTCNCQAYPTAVAQRSTSELKIDYLNSRSPLNHQRTIERPSQVLLKSVKGDVMLNASKFPRSIKIKVNEESSYFQLEFPLPAADERLGLVWIHFGSEVNVSCKTTMISIPTAGGKSIMDVCPVPCMAGAGAGLMAVVVAIILVICFVRKRKRPRALDSSNSLDPQAATSSQDTTNAHDICRLDSASNNHSTGSHALGNDDTSYVTLQQHQGQRFVVWNGSGGTYDHASLQGQQPEGDYHELRREAPRQVVVDNTYDHVCKDDLKD
ncbi:uncharacterized protein [Littorina saxatilis]|uniref:uncharacterized protein n=1 Tax=Littorina saxatilis TaxID=31220 RepID=UPI0038B65BA8